MLIYQTHIKCKQWCYCVPHALKLRSSLNRLELSYVAHLRVHVKPTLIIINVSARTSLLNWNAITFLRTFMFYDCFFFLVHVIQCIWGWYVGYDFNYEFREYGFTVAYNTGSASDQCVKWKKLAVISKISVQRGLQLFSSFRQSKRCVCHPQLPIDRNEESWTTKTVCPVLFIDHYVGLSLATCMKLKKIKRKDWDS